jgi:hypothetical protein
MDTHVKVLAALNIVFGILGLLCALIVMLVFGGIMMGASSDADAATTLPVLGAIGTIAVFSLLILSLPGIVVGIGLWRFRPWSRIGGVVLSILCLLVFPLGTILGVYGLWVLLNKDSERLFTGTASPLPAGPT